MNKDYPFGDSMPSPPVNTVQPDSNKLTGKIFYKTRELVLKAYHFAGNPPPLPQPEEVKRLIVVQFERLGDLVLTEPALRALRKRYSNAERVLIAPPYANELFAGSGWGKCESPDFLDKFIAEHQKADLLIDLTGRLEVKLARRLRDTKIPVRVGLDRGGRGVYLTHSIKPFPITVPTRDIYMQIVRQTGADAEDSIARLPAGQDRRKRGFDYWRELDLKSPVVLMPGAFYDIQRWDIDNFAEVGKELVRQNIEVAVISGPGEEEMGKKLSGSIGCPLVSSPTITRLMDLLASSKLALCNNTGTLHLSCALGIPTVSTMGPTVPWRWWPTSDAPAIVFRGGSDGPVGDLENINTSEVIAAIIYLLND